jgi:hypothetical protein
MNCEHLQRNTCYFNNSACIMQLDFRSPRNQCNYILKMCYLQLSIQLFLLCIIVNTISLIKILYNISLQNRLTYLIWTVVFIYPLPDVSYQSYNITFKCWMNITYVFESYWHSFQRELTYIISEHKKSVCDILQSFCSACLCNLTVH